MSPDPLLGKNLTSRYQNHVYQVIEPTTQDRRTFRLLNLTNKKIYTLGVNKFKPYRVSAPSPPPPEMEDLDTSSDEDENDEELFPEQPTRVLRSHTRATLV